MAIIYSDYQSSFTFHFLNVGPSFMATALIWKIQTETKTLLMTQIIIIIDCKVSNVTELGVGCDVPYPPLHVRPHHQGARHGARRRV